MERRYCYRVGYYILKIFIKIRILLYEFPCKIVYKYLYECYQILCVFISKFVVGECNKCI